MGGGKANSSSNVPDKNWKYAPPKSVDEVILKKVCGHRKK
jgi:hypothetical protein